MSSETTVIVGSVIERNGKFLLVQEAKKECYGKWNLPAGHLNPHKTIIEAAQREAKEETGCEIEPTGILQIGQRVLEQDIFLAVVFVAKLLREEIDFDPAEILDVRWFSYDEIYRMRAELRNKNFILDAIDHARAGSVANLDLISYYEVRTKGGA